MAAVNRSEGRPQIVRRTGWTIMASTPSNAGQLGLIARRAWCSDGLRAFKTGDLVPAMS